jgi:hypothetical protein
VGDPLLCVKVGSRGPRPNKFCLRVVGVRVRSLEPEIVSCVLEFGAFWFQHKGDLACLQKPLASLVLASSMSMSKLIDIRLTEP